MLTGMRASIGYTLMDLLAQGMILLSFTRQCEVVFQSAGFLPPAMHESF